MYATVFLTLDGSPDSLAGARIGLNLARQLGCELLCAHVYDARIHTGRFREMEPGLPDRYQRPEYLEELRNSHDSLISDGFHSLSRGYMDAFRAEAESAGVAARELVREGRNYVELLRAAQETGADLIVVGAHGLGDQGDGQPGSTAVRVLRGATCDVLVVRAGEPGGPVIAGIDGSAHSAVAARRGVVWARVLGRPLQLVATYDPAFHRTIFQTMARSLSPERQAAVGLDRQEELHEELIDDGLGRLYQAFLDEAVRRCTGLGVEVAGELLTGKAYRALVDDCTHRAACLTVVGRFGHNREPESDLGSQAEAVVRLAPHSVLVTAAANAERQDQPQTPGLEWDPEALAKLERVPSFARPMARQAVEERVRAENGSRVTAEAFGAVAHAFGMGGMANRDGG